MKRLVVIAIIIAAIIAGSWWMFPGTRLSSKNPLLAAATDTRSESKETGPENAAPESSPTPGEIPELVQHLSKKPHDNQRWQMIRALHLASSKRAADDLAKNLGSHDYSAAKYELDSTGFCTKLSENFKTFPDFASIVADGTMVDTPEAKASFEYLRSRFQKYCDPTIDYFPRVAPAFADMTRMDTEGPADAQLIARLRSLPKEQRRKYNNYLEDVVANTDSPALLADAAGLLIGSDQWPLGLDLVRGTPLARQLTSIQSAAVNLAYCAVAGTCFVPDSFDAMDECLEGSLCYPGITYWQVIQAETPPQQFAIAQIMAQRILQSRQGK
jgi:hypothetical protein